MARVVFGKNLPLVCEVVEPPVTEWVEERAPDQYYLVKGVKQVLKKCSLFSPTFVELGGDAVPAGQAPIAVAGNQVEFLEVPLISVQDQGKIDLQDDATRQNLPLMKRVYETHLQTNDRRIDVALERISNLATANLEPAELTTTQESIKQEIGAIREDTRQTETALREISKYV